VSELNLHDLGDQPAPDSPARPGNGKGREKENRHIKIRSISDLGLFLIFNLPFASSRLPVPLPYLKISFSASYESCWCF